jgi:hypothetical protein
MKIKLRVVGTIGVTLFVVVMLVLLLRPTSEPSFPPLPDSNSYSDLIQAASLIQGNLEESHSSNTTKLKAWLATNSTALELVRSALEKPCRIDAALVITNHGLISLDEWVALMKVKVLLDGTTRLAKLETNNHELVRAALDEFTFCREISQNGFVMHRLTAVLAESEAVVNLNSRLQSLDSNAMQSILTNLVLQDANDVSWEKFLIRQNYLQSKQTKDWRSPISVVCEWNSDRQLTHEAKRVNTLAVTLRRLFMTELALRLHVQAHNSPPDSLAELVPQRLAAPPIDPSSNKPLKYRRNGAHWILYSVGIDGKDDGGTSVSPVSTTNTAGDLLLTSPPWHQP